MIRWVPDPSETRVDDLKKHPQIIQLAIHGNLKFSSNQNLVFLVFVFLVFLVFVFSPLVFLALVAGLALVLLRLAALTNALLSWVGVKYLQSWIVARMRSTHNREKFREVYYELIMSRNQRKHLFVLIIHAACLLWVGFSYYE